MQASALCLLISRTAKGGTGMVAIAGQCLNLVLEDLKLTRNLKMNRVTQTINVLSASNGPFTLESDYLRGYDLSYALPGGEPQFLNPVTMEQYDAENKTVQPSNYPYEYATDLSTQAQTASGSKGYLYIYPQSNGVLPLTHRYMRDQPDIVTPETSSTVPWFPFNEYLLEAAASLMMGITGDDRKDAFAAAAEKKLAPYLIMQGDEQAAIVEMKLDPRRFRTARATRPTKAMPY